MRPFTALCIFIISTFYSNFSFSQNLNTTSDFNTGWKFHLGGLEFAETSDFNDSSWENVTIPHTWNAKDPFDDDLTYIRGIGWYRKIINLNVVDTTKKTTLHFDGAFQVADVYLNGAFVGRHKGGYTAFAFDVSKYLKVGQNCIAVKVNNAQDQFIPPLSIGYAGYGGIYRPIKWIVKNNIHFTSDKFASSGIKINTPAVSTKNASVNIEANVSNESGKVEKATLFHQIFDVKHQLVKTLTKDFTIAVGKSVIINLETNIENPELWSPETPNLYTIESSIKLDGQIIDETKNPLGLRWFSFNPNEGFTLNGKKYTLNGTNRHQDKEGKGDALSTQDHRHDFKMIKNMGCNFVRLAHYPQSQDVLNLADSLGLLIWEETPLVNYMNIDPEFLANSEHMIKEMIHQNYNHPSVIIWGSMNEILLWSSTGERIQNHENEKDYVQQVQQYAVKLDSVVRNQDPSRYNVIAMHMSNEYDEYHIADIPKISAFNVYSGWYGGKLEEFGASLKKRHQEHPKEIVFISEYGAGGDSRINTSAPVRLDFSGQYQRMFLESYIRQTREMPWLAGTAIWNQFDFSQPNTGGTIPNLNQKGLVNWNRIPKDSYYLFKANWNNEPMIYIASRDWKQRSGSLGQKSAVEIYANLKEVSLTLNGKKIGVKKPNDVQKIVYEILLKQGDNFIKVTGYDGRNLVTDTLTINFKPSFIADNNFKSFYVNIGSKTQYLDADGTIWAEDQPYEKGSYGCVEGENIMMGLKKVIASTTNAPLYYSSLESLEAYKIDIPDGKYKINLGFVETESLNTGERVFDVSANGKSIIKNLDLTAEAGEAKALQKTFLLTIKNNEGLTLNFKSTKGKTLLSNLSVEKLTENKEASISNKSN